MIPRFLVGICLLVFVVSCSSAPEALPPDVNVIVDMKEYTVTLNTPTVKAGIVKFGIRNLGTMVHDFDLIKTDLAPDKLPMDVASAKAQTDGLVKQMINIAQGRVTTVEASLVAGHYVIFCNVAGHYQLGMRAELTVQP
ncbi:MAG TPA: hypothetical protein VGK15_03415 [Candidatus Limnocylindria bacterium]